MAKLHNYYVLCPLIDQKSFLGVAQDKETEHVIVSLGRNVVNKYRLSDQKQIVGWTSKDHITSTVIYDKEQDNYVGVFNNNTIKIWKDDTDNLDKMKKYKFPLNIYKLIPRGNQSPLIIFSNGNCASLSYALENRKTYEGKSIIKDSESIVNVAHYVVGKVDHICYIIKNSRDEYDLVTCPLRDELGDLEKAKLAKEKITRPDDVNVVGLLCTSETHGVYVLWSDSKITVYNLTNKSWKSIGSVPWISTLMGVSIAWMGKNHLILFGSNIDQDGAIIVAYNIVLGVGSCRYPMKMYSEGAKLCCLDGRIILEASNHIGMLPYILETKRNLSSLLGSHDIIQDTNTEIVNWDSTPAPAISVCKEVGQLLSLGLTERNICSQVIPPLIEKDDFRSTFCVLRDFKDVPESILVVLLKYAVKQLKGDKINICDPEEIAKIFCVEEKPKKQQIAHHAKLKFIDYIFQIPFSDALIIPHLRNGLMLNDTLFLLTYISHLLNNSENSVSADFESQLFDWCTLILDAFYQQYLMTKDEKVSYVLKNTMKTVVALIDQLQAVSDVLPMLDKVLSGKEIERDEEAMSYSIELMQI